MEKDNFLDLFYHQHKAIDYAMWLNFKYRLAKIKFGVIHGPEDNWAVCEEATAKEMEMRFIDNLLEDYKNMTYSHIDSIRQDEAPLSHWEDILGIFSTFDGEILRFILKNKLPVDKLIRHELALRGFDKDHRWCGFTTAREIWLK